MGFVQEVNVSCKTGTDKSSIHFMYNLLQLSKTYATTRAKSIVPPTKGNANLGTDRSHVRRKSERKQNVCELTDHECTRKREWKILRISHLYRAFGHVQTRATEKQS